jgi:hypothetical protein
MPSEPNQCSKQLLNGRHFTVRISAIRTATS